MSADRKNGCVRCAMPVLREYHTYPIRVLTRLVAVITVAVLAGCAPPRPLLSPLAPQTLGQSVTARQQVTIRFADNVRRLQVALKVAPDDLTLIGLTAVGQRLFTLSWNGQQAELHSSIDSIADIDPTRILADLQLAYWPLPVLRRALPDDLSLGQYGSARVLWRDGQLLWFASSTGPERWHSTVTIYNARVGYRLTIQPLAFESS